jgi:hypothetical protein
VKVSKAKGAGKENLRLTKKHEKFHLFLFKDPEPIGKPLT